MTLLLRVVTGLLAAAMAHYSQSSFAEATTKFGPLASLGPVTPVEGPYEVTLGGVPHLGYVVERPKQGNVKFVLCDNRFIDVDGKLLERSKTDCPGSDEKGREKPGVNPWVVLDGTLVPLAAFVFTGDKKLVMKKFGVGLNTLPEPFRSFLTKLPSGTPAAP